MKRINVFALIGLIFFNLVISLAVFITIYALLFAAWVSVLSFIVSPLLVIGAHLFQLQAFTLFRFALAIVLALGSAFLLPFLMRVSSTIISLTKAYLAYNLKVIYS